MRIRFDVMDAMEPEYSSVEPENERQQSSVRAATHPVQETSFPFLDQLIILPSDCSILASFSRQLLSSSGVNLTQSVTSPTIFNGALLR